MTIHVRFAPSPTGMLHVGNARVALINTMLARSRGGRFLLRYDDTDAERSRPEFATAIAQDLAWLGITWDAEAHQSARLDRYTAVAEQLKAMGLLYPCYETPEELEVKRRLQLARHRPPVYDRSALKLTDDDRARLEAEGRKSHWRFRLDHEEVRWDDLVRGDSHVDGASLSDPVLIRADGTFLYTLPSVVDDIDFAITHVVRGEDHVTNTAPQIQLFRALGAAQPAFVHLPLLTDAAGQGLSKRLGSASLADLRADGVEPMALASLLVKLGSSDAIEPRRTIAELAAEFDISHFSRATPKFDPNELDRLTAQLLHGMEWDEAQPRLASLGLEDAGEEFWRAVRGNLARFADAAAWWNVVNGPCAPVIEDAGFSAQAAELLPPEPWDSTTWGTWCDAVKQATGRKGRALFHPLRLALTGREHGPELKTLLPLIGRARAVRRLGGETV
jgi:glutamyl-tRNA synthetase